ncbi:hypothetical protein Lal_00017404 [Lupinus albus]|uniref:Uncharacterized protein n=1 Tax=Lupinus albus TaxID=3870 RepID=A0A6A4QNG8_LUPAL|nr:hypothetical protein Lalb_Chr04g0263581 [Lupinus albus]KAF1869827.1 hypothetical protein Lal_00017404 [Lupinus albus]
MLVPVSMALLHKEQNKPTIPLQTHITTVPPWQPRRKINLKKRQKLQLVRLGGNNDNKQRRGMLVRVVRMMRVKWLKLYYIRMLKKLKEYYQNFVKQLAETGSTIETFLFMESNFVIPTGLTISGCPSRHGLDPPRTISV